MKIFKKFKTAWLILINYFYYTARPHILNPIHFLRLISDKNGKSNFKKIDDGDLFRLVEILRKKSQSTGCEYADYLTLYNKVITNKPKSILELGCGISTCVMAYALKKNKDSYGIDGKITTMEESKYYYENFLQIIPNDLKNFIQVIYSERKTKYFTDSDLGCFYNEIPISESKFGYDFLFIDAPQTKYPEDEKKCFDADLINLIHDNKLDDCFIILDQRIGTLWTLNKILPFLKLKYNVVKRHATSFLIKQ